MEPSSSPICARRARNWAVEGALNRPQIDRERPLHHRHRLASAGHRLPAPLDYVCYRFERDDRRITEMEREIIAFLEELDALEKEMRERMSATRHRA